MALSSRLSLECSEVLDSVSEAQGVGVIEECDLVSLGEASVGRAERRILLVEPRALHVSLSLGIVISVVDFTSQI